MVVAIVLAVLATALLGPAGALLDHLTWLERVPKTGVLLWQAVQVSPSPEDVITCAWPEVV